MSGNLQKAQVWPFVKSKASKTLNDLEEVKFT